MSNTVNVSNTTNQVAITPQSTKTVSINSGGDTSIAINQGAANTVSISNNIVDASLTSNNVTIATPPSNGITITDLSTTIAVSQTQTDIVQIASQGPQGPKGDTGATGPQGPTQDTGSLLITASYSNPDLTFTKGDGSTFDIEISGSVNIEGTPVNNQIAFFTNSNTIKGNNQFTYIESTNIFTLSDAIQIIPSDNILFNTGNDDQGFQVKGSSDNNLLQVNPQATDKIGIGTSTPGEKLEVIGNISASNIILPIGGKIGVQALDEAFLSFTDGGGGNINTTLQAQDTVAIQGQGGQVIGIPGGVGTTIIHGNLSASRDLTARSLTVATSSVQDTYMMSFPSTPDGIANRSSYFLSFDPSSEALKHSNFNTNFNMSSSVYYNRVIACDDMTIADGKSIDITGILHIEGATGIPSQVKIDLYTASITPNNSTRLPEPLEFTRSFQGNNIAIDPSAPFTSSHHFTQTFDISTLPTNSVIAVALSNSSAANPVTTNTNVNLSLRLTRNYKKKN